MKKLGIFCSGNLGKEVMDIARRIQDQEKCWREIVFFDNFYNEDCFYGSPVKHLNNEDAAEYDFVIAAGEPKVRETIYTQIIEAGGEFTSIIDPTVIISPTAHVGKGCIITPYTTISSDVVIGENVLLQSYIRVGHGIRIGPHSVISANAAIGGETKIGIGAFIGMGASIIGETTIGDGAILGMGAALYKNLPENTTAVGNPARITKGNPEHKVF